MLVKVLALIMLAFVASCATVGEQTRAVLQAPPDVPPVAQVENVPFVKQTSGYCGPATLTMAMRWAGQSVSLEQVAPEVYTEGKKGSLQIDLISASRRHGLLAVPIDGMVNLLKEIAAGHPVIVLENQGLSWWPQWHYSVVLGYDLKEQELVMHSGQSAYKRVSFNYFERGWKLADYWGLVVVPPGELPASADELTTMQAAAGLEQAQQLQAAAQAYLSVLERWPASLTALIGLGNIAYKNHDFVGSLVYLKRAAEFHPESSAARHNLAVAEAAVRQWLR